MKSRHMLRIFALMAVLALLPFLILAPAHARDVPFPDKHTVDGSFNGATDVATADIDGDGDLDVLGAATTADEIAWWENVDLAGPGSGDGSAWSKHVVDGSFDGAHGVAAADVDGDGDLDIFGAARLAGEIAWWKNTAGDGSAWSKQSIDSTFDWVANVTGADVDGDGDMDVLGAGYDSNEVAWWENTVGDGSAWIKHIVTADYNLAYDVVAADLDQDGDQDVLASTYSEDNIAWWENTAGDGSAWSKHTVTVDFNFTYGVVAVDIDGDGDPDILGASDFPEDISQLQNAALAEEGDADPLGASDFNDEIVWLENVDRAGPGSGDGSAWNKHTVDGSFDGAIDVFGADVDGDGDQDVLGAAFDANEIAWWENVAGDGSAWSKHSLDADFPQAARVAAADVDGDGDPDVLGVAFNGSEIAWWENETIHRSALYPGAGQMTVDPDFGGVRNVATADVDGDGDQDIVGAAADANEIAWWENNNEDGSVWSKHHVWTWEDAYDVVAGDVDGDGDLDILGGSWQGHVAWFENTVGDGSAWHGHTVDSDTLSKEAVAGADVDGDGDLDILAVGNNTETTQIAWWENTMGDGSAWSKHSLSTFYDSTHDVAAADVDGDGDLDILGAVDQSWSNNPGGPAWWENTAGDGSTWSGHLVNSSFADAQAVVAADMDGDGDMDILGGASIAIDGYDRIAWWENVAGDGSAWNKHTVDRHFEWAQSVAAADLDADGDLDIFSASGVSGGLAWWENTSGDGSAWSKQAMGKHHGEFRDAAAADVDGDGDLDLFAAAWRYNEIIGWKNLGGQFALGTADTAPTQLARGESDDLLKITMTHRGRSGDGDEELATLELLFEESEGDPLTSAEANAVIGELAVYLDDGSGDFEIGSDTLVATADTLDLSDGIGIVTLPDGDANVQVQFGTPRTYFVVVQLAADAYAQTAIHQFRITHITESSSTADDRDHDIPLILEYAANVASSEVSVPRGWVWDGGGATENWSEAANWVDDILPADAYDGVYFNDTSSKNAIIDAAFGRTPAGVIISPEYTGQIAQDADLSVIEGWHQDGGTFTGGGSTLDIGGGFDLSGGSFTAPSGLMSVGGGFHHTGGSFDPNGGRVVLDSTNDQTLATTFHDLVLNDGLLGYWKLDEGTGTTAVDSSGYGHGGALQNSPTWIADTPTTAFNDPAALHFDRSDADHVSISGTDAIDDMQQLTIATWVKLDTMPADHIMRFVTLTNEKAVLRYDGHKGTGPLHFYMKIDGSLHGISATDVLSTGAWLHVAGTYDGSTMRLYLNGVELDTNTISGTVGTGDGIRFGWSAGGEALDGLLDDVRVYNRALPVMEISDLADGKHPQTAIATTTLGEDLDVDGNLILNSGTLAQPETIGYWKLDEDTGTTASDSSSYGYDGTLQNSPTWSTDTTTTHFSNPHALQFDRGDADHVSITGTDAIDDMQQLTLATWVKLDTMPPDANMRFVTLTNEKAVLRYDGYKGAGPLHFYMNIDGNLHGVSVTDVLSTGTWLHVAGTYDGSTMRLYLNGMELATKTISGTVATGDGLRFSWSSGNEALDGLLDDVRIYNRALSATAVQSLADGYDVRAHDITIGGDFIRNGGVYEAGGGMVTFDGSSTQNLDTDTITLYDMTVNAGSTLVIQRDITVEGTLTNNGTLQQIKDPVGAGAAYLSYGGYGGVLIADLSGTDPGDTTVSIRGNQDCTDMAGETVQRCFDIAPTVTSGLDTLVQFFFDGSELSGNDCNTLNAYHWTGGDWEELTLDTSWGGDGRACETEPYSVRVKDVSDFSPFVLKSSAPCKDAVTPEETSIDLTGTGNMDVLLGWDDNSANAGGYEVHRSTSPYFMPDSGSLEETLPAGSTSYTDAGAAGSTSENYTYIVRGVGNCGALSGWEKRQGEFDFGLVPGNE